MTTPEDSNPRRNLLRVSNWVRKWLKHGDDVIAPALLQGIDINKPVPPQFVIDWEELLGEVPQVPISAPSGSANDYAGSIVQEDLDSLLLELPRFLSM